MTGFPLTQAKWLVRAAIEALRTSDTFNLISFSGDDHHGTFAAQGINGSKGTASGSYRC